MTTALLSLKDVSINIGDKTLVDKLSIDVFPGKTTALVGESGSGKSITAMSILKLLPNIMQVSGEALFDGVDLYSLNDEDLQQYRRKDIAFIFQEPMTALNPLHTVERQISECITNAAFTNDKRARVITLLTQVDLPSTDEKLKA
ncbi:MAG: ABC transporter ATP-binding protein, partial [Sinobacterium sp.]|nr:ABC transporter ATP-binding protein [Sinobacterium sp.]